MTAPLWVLTALLEMTYVCLLHKTRDVTQLNYTNYGCGSSTGPRRPASDGASSPWVYLNPNVSITAAGDCLQGNS